MKVVLKIAISIIALFLSVAVTAIDKDNVVSLLETAIQKEDGKILGDCYSHNELGAPNEAIIPISTTVVPVNYVRLNGTNSSTTLINNSVVYRDMLILLQSTSYSVERNLRNIHKQRAHYIYQRHQIRI